MTFQGLTYCWGYLNVVQGTGYGVGARIALTLTVDGVSGSQVLVSGPVYCPPGIFCGATLASGTVTFPAGATLPVAGDVIQLYGVTTQGALAPTGFVVTGHCDPAWGC